MGGREEMVRQYKYSFAAKLGLDEDILEPECREEIRSSPELQELLQKEYRQFWMTKK